MTDTSTTNGKDFLTAVARKSIPEDIISKKVTSFVTELNEALKAEKIQIKCTSVQTTYSVDILIELITPTEQKEILSFFVYSSTDHTTGNVRTTYGVADSQNRELADNEQNYNNLGIERDYEEFMSDFQKDLKDSFTTQDGMLIAEALEMDTSPKMDTSPEEYHLTPHW